MRIFGIVEPQTESTFPFYFYYNIEASDVTTKHHAGSPVCLHPNKHTFFSICLDR